MVFIKKVRNQPEPFQPDMAKELISLQKSLSDIMAESWRFGNAMEKVLLRLDIMEAERFARQYSYFSDKVRRAASDAGLNCLDLTGQIYDVGIAVTADRLISRGTVQRGVFH